MKLILILVASFMAINCQGQTTTLKINVDTTRHNVGYGYRTGEGHVHFDSTEKSIDTTEYRDILCVPYPIGSARTVLFFEKMFYIRSTHKWLDADKKHLPHWYDHAKWFWASEIQH